jgi:ribosomal 50S subunit-associated protein YjgA (DUF615 family)
MEKISWTDRVRNEEVLLRVKDQRNILHAVKRRKANLVGQILRRNCRLKDTFEGKVEAIGGRGRRRKQLLEELNEMRGHCKLREKALDRTLWKTRFGRGYGPVIRQTAE